MFLIGVQVEWPESEPELSFLPSMFTYYKEFALVIGWDITFMTFIRPGRALGRTWLEKMAPYGCMSVKRISVF